MFLSQKRSNLLVNQKQKTIDLTKTTNTATNTATNHRMMMVYVYDDMHTQVSLGGRVFVDLTEPTPNRLLLPL